MRVDGDLLEVSQRGRADGSLTDADRELINWQLSLEVEDHPGNTTRTSRNVDTLRHSYMIIVALMTM